MVRENIEVFLQKMEIVYVRLDLVFFGININHVISKPSDKYGIFDKKTNQIIVLCESYNMALNYCQENEYEVTRLE